MNWNLFYGCLTLLSCMASVGLGAYLLHHRRNKRVRYLIFLFAGSAVWAGAYAMELISPGLDLKLMWVRLEYLGAGTVGLLLLRFVLVAVDRPGRLVWGLSGWLWILPVVVVLSAFTNDFHHLLWKDAWLVIRPEVQALQYHRGPVFWLHTITAYTFIGLVFILLIQNLISSRGIQRKQVMVLICGILVPWIANGIYLTGLPGLSYIDLSPTAFMVSCGVFALGLFRYHLLLLLPLAHEAVMDGLGDPVIVLDMDDRMVEINQAGAVALNLGAAPLERIHLEDGFPGVYGGICKARETDAGELEVPLDTGENQTGQWHLRVSPLWKKKGRQSGWLVVLRDITHQKAAQKALLNAKNYVGSIINSMPSVIIGVDRQGRVVHWNHGAGQMAGISEGRTSGMKLASIFPQLAPYGDDIKSAMDTREPVHMEKQYLVFDSGTIIADILIFPILSEETSGAVIRVDDISEQTRVREMMVQSEKMMSIGGLAAGMAHEINNPLSGMIQNIQVIRNRLSRPLPANLEAAERHGLDLERLKNYMEDRRLFYMMDQVVDVGVRAGKIVDNMLSFSRKNDGEKSSHAIPDIVDATISLLEKDFNLRRHCDFRRLKIDRVFEDDLPLVPCEKSKIQQVLFNIVKNGVQAMSRAGTPDPRFTIRYFLERDMAGVEIRDNGPGIPEQVQKRIFEPFFTTKPVGSGTGLGLSVSYFIVKENHNGDLSAVSGPGHGAAFTIKLPLGKPVPHPSGT